MTATTAVTLAVLAAPAPPAPALVHGGPAPEATTARRLASVAAAPVPAVARGWPVGRRPLIVRGWDPPDTPYGRGHRGVDLRAEPGGTVRTVAAGVVTYAGGVAGRGVVVVTLAGTGTTPLRTTYEPVSPQVRTGERLLPGAPLGVVQRPGKPAHCGGTGSCLHWGLLRGDAYLNPLRLLPPGLRRPTTVRLLPLDK